MSSTHSAHRQRRLIQNNHAQMGSMAIDSGAIVSCSHFSYVGATNCLARFFSRQGQAEVRDMGCVASWGCCRLRDRSHLAMD